MQGHDDSYIKQMVKTAIPLCRFFDLELLEIRKGYVKTRIPFRTKASENFSNRQWHSSILASVMNSVGSIVGIPYLEFNLNNIASISLEVDFYREIKDVAIIVKGEVFSFEDNIFIVSFRAWQRVEENLIAEGNGIYEITNKQSDAE